MLNVLLVASILKLLFFCNKFQSFSSTLITGKSNVTFKVFHDDDDDDDSRNRSTNTVLTDKVMSNIKDLRMDLISQNVFSG